MGGSYEFLSLVLDAITENIVVIDDVGEIKFVNKTWSEFGDNNACMIGDSWKGVNYIDECDKAAAMGDEFGAQAGEGIKSVISQEQENFYFEYPCHSPDEKRWFMMRVTPFQSENNHYFVISHQNITERKLAEEKVRKLARIDGLTDIANRRTFDDFLHQEWKRCSRLNKPICLAIADRLLKKIANLNIMNSESPTERYLTASIGLAEVVPARGSEESGLVSKADSELYKAKECGRNRVES